MALSIMKKTKSEEKPKVLPSKYNKGWSGTESGWMPSKYDVKLRAMAEPLVAQKMKYISSPTYKKRLTESGEKNANELVKNRLERLKNIEFLVGPQGSSATDRIPGTQSTTMQIASGSPLRQTIAHEMGHVTANTGSQIASSATQGQPGSMSPIEAWKFLNADKTLTPANKAAIYKWYSRGASNFGQYKVDPSEGVLSGDIHAFGSGEAKADLDSFRQMLIDNKITKKYGEDITPEIMKKAAENKEINKSLFYNRLKDRFGHEGIIKLNNEIAAVNTDKQLNQA